jgi:hypothetical protein
MSRLIAAAEEIDSFLGRQGWRYCLVGGIAVPRWGEPRTTQDVDICLLAGLGDEAVFIEELLREFKPRIESAAAFAEINRVVLIRASNGIAIDVALGWTPFEEKMLDRATRYEFAPGAVLPTATAEDLVIMKAFAGRPQDWIDVNGILARQRGKLDWDYIRSELALLCELRESPEILDELERLRARIDAE